jgi:hypothetical protein
MPCLNSMPANRHLPLLLTLAATLLTGCGLGSAGISSSLGNSDSNAATAASALTVTRSTTSPATISFELIDQEGDPANVEILFDAGAGFAPITLATGSGPLVGIPTTGDAPVEVLWDFAADLSDESFQDDIAIQLNVLDGSSPPVLFGVSQGNDAPQVSEAGSGLALPESQIEYSGSIDVEFLIRDSGSDRVRIIVEYQTFDQQVASGYKLARSGALLGTQPTPQYAFEDLLTLPNDTRIGFRWNSIYSGSDSIGKADAQLGGKETDVQVRFTVEDLDAELAPTGFTSVAETERFRVDNNEQPLAILDEANFLLNPDQRRGIAVPFSVLDEESDPVRVVLQWRREGEDFPPLPGTVAEVLALIDDPARESDRQLAQVGRQVPKEFTGRVGFMDPPTPADRIRLPELGGRAADFLARGIAGEAVEILRPSIPEEVSWAENPPRTSVAAVAREDGLTAVLLEPDASGWSLCEIDLSSGITQPFASGSGTPLALSVDPSRRHLFVATDTRVFRIAYLDGAEEGSIVHAFVDGPRGLAAMGEDLVMATGDNALVSINFAAGSEEVTVLLSGLKEPWGLVADPLRVDGLYLAEHGADRLLALDLHSQVPVTVTAEVPLEDIASLGPDPFPGPRALALEGGGKRLLVMTEWASAASLRGLNLRSPIELDNPPDLLADPFVFEITDQLSQPDAGRATGPDQVRIVCMANALALGGGVQQRRFIVDEATGPGDPEPYDPSTQVVALETGFDPALSGVVSWRIRSRLREADSSPSGNQSLFLWDSSEVLGGGKIQVRILPIDADVGIVSPVTGFKQVRWGLDVPPTALVDIRIDKPFSVAAGDLDGDGDMDLVSANLLSDNLTIFFQESPGQFAIDPTGPLSTVDMLGPRSVAIGDLDGDGDMDLVSANQDSNNLTVFFQVSPAQFAIDPSGPLATVDTIGPRSVAIGDLDGDGDLDIVSANGPLDNLTIFFQTSPGSFTFGSNSLLLGLDNPLFVAIGDLNGDGAQDIVAANKAGDSLSIFFQTSPGQFTFDPDDALADLTLDGPVFVAIGDLDGDGDMDLISANQYSENLTIFFQTTPGSFTFDPNGALSEPVLDDPVSVALFDLDADGDLDLVTANLGDADEIGNLTTFFQTSPGQYTANPSGPITDPILDSPRSVAIGDFDGDGEPDFVSANEDNDNLTVFLHASRAQYTVDGNGPLGDPSMDTTWDPIIGDFDGDGDLDLATTNRESNNITPFLQTSPGQFELSLDGPLTDPNMERPNALVTGDLDGDGDLDIASSNAFTNNLLVFFQTSPGDFTSAPLSLEDNVVNPRDLACGDLNADGLLDLVSANYDGNSLTIFLQDTGNPGQFIGQPPLTATGGWMTSPASVTLGDLNGDGYLDLVSANEWSHNLTIFFQDPANPGQFAVDSGGPLGGLSIMRRPFSVAIGDLDGDGDLDIVSANWAGEFSDADSLTIFFQTSTGQFTLDPGGPLTHSSVDGPQTVAIADLDGDGDMDLVSANFLIENLTVFHQVNPGRFAIDPRAPLSAPSTTSPGTLAVGDLDGDGDPDIVSANEFSNTLTIFFGSH